MMACSAALSTSLTKSFGPLVSTFSRSRSSEARLMMVPALRAALMAMLSMGWSACDMGRPGEEEGAGGGEIAAGGRSAGSVRHVAGGAATRGVPVRLRALRHEQRRGLPLPRLPEHPDARRLRLAQPRAGGAADRVRLAPGARRLRSRAARAGRE